VDAFVAIAKPQALTVRDEGSPHRTIEK